MADRDRIAKYAANLAAAAPPLTAEQIEGAARILASVDHTQEELAA